MARALVLIMVFAVLVYLGLKLFTIVSRNLKPKRQADELDKVMYAEYKQLKLQSNLAKTSKQKDYAKALDAQAEELLRKIRE